MDDLTRLEALVGIMDRLREPGGCPWDREQTYESLRGYLLEECHEVADALDRDDPEGLCEELGDLLFQIVFLSRLAKEQGRFSIADVVRGIAEKMIRRHPHVFGSATAETPEEVVERWEEIKRREKAGRKQARRAASVLDGLPASLPPTLRARRMGERAARAGFDWDSADQVLDQLGSELREARAALEEGDERAIRDEIGDLLFTTVMLARKVGVDPDAALQQSNVKFRARFGWVEAELQRRGVPIENAGMELLESLWQRSKQELKRP